MKIIHCADVHLGSRMQSKFPPDKAAVRKAEVRAAFSGMVGYAAENGVKVILLSGDVFDSDRPVKKDKEFFYNVVKGYPDIDFLYLRGNHDGEESYTESDLANLKTFSSEWTRYSYGNIDIYGVEFARDNARSLYSTLRADPQRLNIVMLHGQISDSDGMDKVNLSRLRNKNIDYLALGHVHSCSSGKLDERGVYAYSGCLEGRGFDEPGEKGFMLLDVTDKISYQFIPRSRRRIVEVCADVSTAEDSFAACRMARASIGCAKDDIVSLILTGEISFDNEGLAREAEKMLEGEYFLVSVKDKTVRKFDLQSLSGDKSLQGEFIRGVLADENLTPEQQTLVISAGLKALSGREVE